MSTDDANGRSPIVWVAGVGWDDIPGTDRRMAEALAALCPVIWIDSPQKLTWSGLRSRRTHASEQVGENLQRVRVPAPPGFSRWPIRLLTAVIHRRVIARSLPRGTVPRAIVVADPVMRFPDGVPGPRLLYVTDDWLAGASAGLMRYAESWIRGVLSSNAQEADAVAAITTPILDQVHTLGVRTGTPVAIVPNGAPKVERVARTRRAIAGLVGQLNERLDLPTLEAVVDSGVPLRLIGPRFDRQAEFSDRLDALIARDDVEWTGSLGSQALAAQLAEIGVGLTPYAESDFNRASFPLKTLEYLAAGVAVVSTDLAASRWLDTEHVTVTTSAAEFADAVRSRASAVGFEGEAIELSRIELAERHGWPQRAVEFLALADRAAVFAGLRGDGRA
ncbi:glycosyltransferase [Agromyces larvae]|uniref:Glycosyltransferase n=1 Tax=Agromyces larvae TaxID=2929802 RepID=A0ABY4BU99_9MICO|nr:glycosyltransferase [Agromyces larvae]UOE42754.1 glycosyltransferase [Agromyces larvae]